MGKKAQNCKYIKLPKLICKLKNFSTNTVTSYLVKFYNLILNFLCKTKGTATKTKKEAMRFILPDIRTHQKMNLIKMKWYLCRDTYS